MKRLGITVAAAALIFFAGYAALFIAPDESTMHAIQRVFYVHLPLWLVMYTALTIAFIANIAWLATRQIKWDWLGVSAVEVGVVSCTGGLATGVLWGKPAWGIWWTWDARLTTAFLLWLLYIAYLLLRGLLEDPDRRATLSASLRHLRVSRCAAGVCGEPAIAERSASGARDFRGAKFRPSSDDGEGAVGVHDCDVAGDDPAAGGSLPARSGCGMRWRSCGWRSRRRRPIRIRRLRGVQHEEFRFFVCGVDGGLGRCFSCMSSRLRAGWDACAKRSSG